MDAKRRLADRIRIRNINGENEHCHSPLGDRGLTRHDRLSQRLLGGQDHFAKNAAAPEDILEVHFLNEIESQLASHHLAGNQDDRCSISIRLIQPVDKVQAARSAAAGHCCQAVHQKRFGLSRIGARLLMAHVDELNVTATNASRKCVQRVPHDAIAMLDTR
jgi:hypothetical protein